MGARSVARCGASPTGAVDFVARRWGALRLDSREIGLRHQLHCSMEEPICCRALGRTVLAPCRPSAPSGQRTQEARILKWTTQRKPVDGSTHWSSRKLSAELGDVSHMSVARVWTKHGLKPHRLERYMASQDADFESKAADIIGLYLNPPQHAAIFSVDEKTAIQALDRKDPGPAAVAWASRTPRL